MTRQQINHCLHPRLLATSSLLLFSVSSVLAQNPASGTLRVEVDLATVEVSVNDKKGQHFSKLGKQDFQLWVDGKEQEILTFDEIGPEVSAEKDRECKVVLVLFDDILTPLPQIRSTREAAKSYIAQHMKTGDLAAVVVRRATVTIVQNFTQQASKVIDAIDKSAEMITAGRQELPSLGLEGPVSVANQPLSRDGLAPRDQLPIGGAIDLEVLNSLSASMLSSLSASMQQVKGRKAILVFSVSSKQVQALDMQSDAQARYRDLFNQQTDKNDGVSKHSPIQVYSIDPENMRDWKDRLDRFDAELSNYYVFGFQPPNSDHKRKFHEVIIKTNVKGARLKYRSELEDQVSQDSTLESKIEQPLMAALGSSTALNQLPLSFRTAYFYASRNRVQVAISARVQAKTLKFKEQKGQRIYSLNVIGIVLDRNSAVAARFAEPYQVILDKANGQGHDSAIYYQRMIKLLPGEYTIKLAVADKDVRIGTSAQDLIIPRMEPAKPAISSLVVTQQLTMLPTLIQDIQSRLMQEVDPLIYKTYRVSISAERYLDRQKPMVIFFKLYNVPDQSALEAKAQLKDENGKQVLSLPSIALDSVAVASGGEQLTIAIKMPTSEIPPGKYKLLIETTDRKTNQSVSAETELEII